MPWKVSDRVSERMTFISRLLDGERMTDLCAEYGVSRKTGYKLLERFRRLGPMGLFDASRRPVHMPLQTSDSIRQLVVEGRLLHRTWGPRKLRVWLSEKHPGVKIPCTTTIGQILARKGLVVSRKRRARVAPYTGALGRADAPNAIWCADYKGQFRLGNGRYCFPLTVTDQFSRYLLACEGFEAINGDTTRAVFEQLFAEYGLPRAIRTDNGAPFASRGLFGLSRLSAWWLKLGIVPERIEPAHPEQNGRHERMHRTLKAETTRPAAATLLQQQERFDVFVEHFNRERPHEALGQRRPIQLYSPSTRSVSGVADRLEYPLHDQAHKVSPSGHVHVGCGRDRRAVFLSSALGGERVGLREQSDGRWLISYATIDLGCYDPVEVRFIPADRPVRLDGEPDLSPMSPV
jgi:transposase InsO family protein